MEFGTLPQTIVLSSLPSEQSKWLSHFFAISTHPPPVMHLNYLHFNATKCKYVPPSETSKRTNKQLWINSASQHTQSLRILNASNVKHWISFEIKNETFKKNCTKNVFVNVRSAFFLSSSIGCRRLPFAFVQLGKLTWSDVHLQMESSSSISLLQSGKPSHTAVRGKHWFKISLHANSLRSHEPYSMFSAKINHKWNHI